MLRLPADVVRDLEQAAQAEWLLADGLGGYASSTTVGLNTRRYQAGLGTVSEVFDGDPPHRPGGGIAEAWSVAELLRLARRLNLRRPRFPPREREPAI